MDVPVALGEPAEEHRAEVHGPDPVGDFLEPDVLLGQHVTAVDPGVLPANAAVAADQAALKMAGVVDLRWGAGIGPRGGDVDRRGRLVTRSWCTDRGASPQ